MGRFGKLKKTPAFFLPANAKSIRSSTLAQKDEISSTEKLLDLIRDHTTPPSSANKTESSASPPKHGLFDSLTFQKPIGIGVEIGNADIRVAKINRISDTAFTLLDYGTTSVEPIETYDRPALAKTLSTVLSRFCTGLKRYEIWCCVASAKVETRYIRIPKLPKKQIPNAVFWTFSKEVDFNEKQMLLDFRILGDVNENGITKTQVMTFTIPIAETQALKRLFAMAGYPLSGISIVPFAIQNLLKTGIVPATGHNTCCLFIGRDWSRITIYAEGDLILSRGIKAGMRSMIDALSSHYRHPSTDDTPVMPDNAHRDRAPNDEMDAHDVAAHEDFQRYLIPDTDTDADTPPDRREPDDIFQAILPAVERLVKQVERTISHFSLHFKRSGVGELFISGRVTGSPAIISHISAQLGVPVNVLDPFPQPHPFTQKVTIPALPPEKESYVPAIGIGLSSNDLTPNFLFTYRHREKRDRARKIRIAISAACIGVLAFLLGGFLWQENRISTKAVEVARLTQKRDAFNVPLTRDLVMALYAKVNQKRNRITTLSHRYYCSAIIAEACGLVPDNIHLIGLRADMDTPSKNTKNKTGATLEIEGIVTGDKIRFETDLASYMLTMEASPLFKKPVVKNKRLQYLDDRQVLRFSLRLELV
jgi:Tfp pilus assembly PilM family ATPase/Tfp pilus assembly protein PilN